MNEKKVSPFLTPFLPFGVIGSSPTIRTPPIGFFQELCAHNLLSLPQDRVSFFTLCGAVHLTVAPVASRNLP